MNVDTKKSMDGEAVRHGHNVRDVPLDKLKALLLTKAELILSTLSDNILNSVAANKGELFLMFYHYHGIYISSDLILISYILVNIKMQEL